MKNNNYLVLLFSCIFILFWSCKSKPCTEIKYNYYTEIINDFKNGLFLDVELDNTVFIFTGKITGIQYPVYKDKKNLCTVFFGLPQGYHGPDVYNYIAVEMKSYIDQSYIGKEISIIGKYKKLFNHDNVLQIILNDGEVISYQ